MIRGFKTIFILSPKFLFTKPSLVLSPKDCDLGKIISHSLIYKSYFKRSLKCFFSFFIHAEWSRLLPLLPFPLNGPWLPQDHVWSNSLTSWSPWMRLSCQWLQWKSGVQSSDSPPRSTEWFNVFIHLKSKAFRWMEKTPGYENSWFPQEPLLVWEVVWGGKWIELRLVRWTVWGIQVGCQCTCCCVRTL